MKPMLFGPSATLSSYLRHLKRINAKENTDYVITTNGIYTDVTECQSQTVKHFYKNINSQLAMFMHNFSNSFIEARSANELAEYDFINLTFNSTFTDCITEQNGFSEYYRVSNLLPGAPYVLQEMQFKYNSEWYNMHQFLIASNGADSIVGIRVLPECGKTNDELLKIINTVIKNT